MATVEEKVFQDFMGIREFDGEKYVKYEKYQQIVDELSEKQYELDNLKIKVSDIENQNGKRELPKEPIKVAEMLIYEKITYETSSIARAFGAGDTGTCNLYSNSDLRQIAEHLLAYCNNSEGE